MTTSEKRVLHVYKDVHPEVPGGIERHVDDLRHHVLGLKSDVLIARRGCHATRVRESAGQREVAVWQLGRLLSTPVTAGYPLWLRRLAPDVVHLHMPNPAAELSALTLPRNVPLVVSYHADIVRQAGLLPAYRLLIDKVLRRADVVVSGSGRLIETSPFLQRFSDKTLIIPYAVDVAAFARSRVDPRELAAAKAPGDMRTVVSTGRLVYYKGFARLVDLANRIDGRVLIVGGGPLEAALRKRATTRANVVFTGPVSDRMLRAHLAASDVFVLPSVNRAESFGIATIEAQAMGLPAVVTDVGTGTIEAVEDGVTGRVVPAADDVALVAALNGLLGDHAQRALMGEAARIRTVKRFNIQTAAAAHEALYRSLLDG